MASDDDEELKGEFATGTGDGIAAGSIIKTGPMESIMKDGVEVIRPKAGVGGTFDGTKTTSTATTSSKKRSLDDSIDVSSKGTGSGGPHSMAGQHGEGTTTTTTTTGGSSSTLLSASLYRLTDGIPQRELRLVVTEAELCEKALEEELAILQKALINSQQSSGSAVADSSSGSGTSPPTPSPSPSVIAMLESEATPPDLHWTLSALLGRLRHDLTTPLPPNSLIPAHREKAGLQHLANTLPIKKKKTNAPNNNNVINSTTTTPIPTTVKDGPDAAGPSHDNMDVSGGGVADDATLDATKSASLSTGATTTRLMDTGRRPMTPTTSATTPQLVHDGTHFQRLAQLVDDLPEYVVDHPDTEKLLALWKKISTHRASVVFRRPVNPKEAPGYSDRIMFPMDLSLVRKFIVNQDITNYRGIAQMVHLIGHNCVKYNGRESDYALVAREFESIASEYIFTAVCDHYNNLGSSSNINTTTTSTDPAASATTANDDKNNNNGAPSSTKSVSTAGGGDGRNVPTLKG